MKSINETCNDSAAETTLYASSAAHPSPLAFVAHKNGVRWDDCFTNLEWTRFLLTWDNGKKPNRHNSRNIEGASGKVGLQVDVTHLPTERLILLAGEALAALELTAARTNYRLAYESKVDISRDTIEVGG